MTRTDVLNHLIEKYRLNTYLELGTQNKSQNFNLINTGISLKTCVDMDSTASPDWVETTDEFFEHWSKERKFDLIFIDASHYAEQVEKDFRNACTVLSSGGFIVLHDCNPVLEKHTTVPRPTPTGHWSGDVYKFACQLIDITTVDVDNGCGVVREGSTRIEPECMPKNWDEFDKQRKILLNLKSWDEFVKLKL